MVLARIKELNLDEGVEHLKTDWVIATSITFDEDSIVLQSLDDEVNLTTITWPDVLDPTIKYYGKARAILSTGPTYWGNIDIFTPQDIDDIDLESDMPGRVSPPSILTTSDFKKHDVAEFSIILNGFGLEASGVHSASSYVIEDKNGDIIWDSIYDIVNKTSIKVRNLILEPNEIYRLRAMFHASTGDTSLMTTKTIFTANPKELELKTLLYDYDYYFEKTLELVPYNGITETTWEILVVENNITESVFKETTDSPFTITIPARTLKPDMTYLLKITSNLDTGARYIPFSTYKA